jgi:alkylation response protein AidB-like acyl-CoA dehydrogenase
MHVESAERLAAEVLAPRAAGTDRGGAYPEEQLAALAQAGLYGIAVPRAHGGLELPPGEQARIFRALARGCVATAFVLSQHHVVTALLAVSDNEAEKARWLPGLARGEIRGADGINFLRMPAERAPMRATPAPGGWVLGGVLPWVTAAHHSDVLVCGAVLPDSRQLIVALPMDERVRRGDAVPLMALEASDTGPVHLDDCFVPAEARILGPDPDVLASTPRMATTYVPLFMGLGHVDACLDLIEHDLPRKGSEAIALAEAVRAERSAIESIALDAAERMDGAPATALRGRLNFLVQRAAHLALIVGGGTGYRRDAPHQRLYREGAFWSVWSVGGGITPAMLEVLLAH